VLKFRVVLTSLALMSICIIYICKAIHHRRQNAQSSFVGCLSMLPVSKTMQHRMRGRLNNDGLGKRL